MQHSLQEVFADNEQLWVLGFTDQVSLLMDASNVVFTKPGGITSTEAIVKHIPLIHTTPIPGLENHNAHFFHQHGLSYYTNDVSQQVAVAMRLCQDKMYRQQMLRQQREHANTRTSDDVIDLILSEYEETAIQ
jgi:processive 1,2-diacylglycerol beta-glucosyltransferase